jgi:membrane-bound lytic murein transglycosylase D
MPALYNGKMKISKALSLVMLSIFLLAAVGCGALSKQRSPSRAVHQLRTTPQQLEIQDEFVTLEQNFATPIVATPTSTDLIAVAPEPLKKLRALEVSGMEFSKAHETPLIFDLPVTYNDRVRGWIRFFQTTGRSTFRNWLQRSSRFLPFVQYELSRAGLPLDLAYVAMVESGFTPHATSPAGAKGMWQFISETGGRYGLRIDWWIDERKDFRKSTLAAIRYMTDLYQQFNSWYLVAASYNMGENGVRRLIQRHRTTNFWVLAEKGVLPLETRDYLPKIIAAMLISKAPALYGFRDLEYQMPLSFESITVPGGTDIPNLATYLGVSERYLKDLNPELLKGLIPMNVRRHKIRVPKGSMLAVSEFIRLQARNDEVRPLVW